MSILQMTGVTKRFRGALALDRLNLDVPEGSVFALLGTNGAGKTTALKILMNIHQPTSGRAETLGIDSQCLSAREFQQIGYVSENQDMPEWMTVGYFLAYLKAFYPAWDDQRASELLRQFNLPLERKLKHLSRGMRMKASLASSLAYRPRLIVLDEPFGGLDPLVRDELIEGLLESASESTILISSHDLAEIESFASHVGYLERGRLQFAEETSALSARFRDVEVTLDTAAELTANWPATWLQPERSGTVVRFVEAHFEESRTMAEVRAMFGEPRGVSIAAMPLRSIFVTLAKEGGRAA